MNIPEELMTQTITFLAGLIAIYIEYRIAKHLIKFGIDYFYEKRKIELRLKEGREDIKDIEADIKRHLEEDR